MPYQVIFCAYESGFNPVDINGVFAGKSDTGHAFVCLCNNGQQKAHGFWPQIDSWGKCVLGTPGEIREENMLNAQFQYCLNISEDEYLTVQDLRNKWVQNPREYKLLSHDCINYAYAIAESLGLDHDTFCGSGTFLPVTAVASIRDKNPNESWA